MELQSQFIGRDKTGQYEFNFILRVFVCVCVPVHGHKFGIFFVVRIYCALKACRSVYYELEHANNSVVSVENRWNSLQKLLRLSILRVRQSFR